jgi:hypothetical protein
MARMFFTTRILSVVVLVGGSVGLAHGQDVEKLLAIQPAIPGVTISTPGAAELATCRAEKKEWAANAQGVKPTGVTITDSNGRKLRQFIDTAGTGKFSILSYYVDGVETFREMDTNGNGKPDTFRWLGSNGSKIGVDKDEDGTVDNWKSISAEEISQELFAALQTGNKNRFRALLMTEEELKVLALPAADDARIKAKLAGADAKFNALMADLKLTAKSRWMHAELSPPMTTAGDTLASGIDLVKHRNIPILLDIRGEGKEMGYMSTNELVLVGRTWRMVDGPILGTPSEDTGEANIASMPPEIKEYVDKLIKIPAPATNADAPAYHLARAALLEKCVAGTKGAQQLPWLKQLIDSYAAAIEADPANKTTLETLNAWQKAIDGGGAAETKAYIAFRKVGADYAVRRKDAEKDSAKLTKVELARKDDLEAYIKNYGTSPDAADAMMQLAMSAEFNNAEAGAKTWYERIIKEHGTNNFALKAAGAVKRLTSDGKVFELEGKTFDGANFTSSTLKGKPTIVMYWASWANTVTDDLKVLATLAKEKLDFNIVTICVDDESTFPQAKKLLEAAALPGTHLYSKGGLDSSPLATAYGIHMVPHTFVLTKEMKVSSKNFEDNSKLKAEIEKLAK